MNPHKINLSIFFKIAMAVLLMSSLSFSAQTVVNVSTLEDLQNAMVNSDQHIIMAAGDYLITDLKNDTKSFNCSGSNNTIDMIGVYIDFPVGSTSDDHFILSGDNNTLRGGFFEDTYYNGLTDITDYETYNNDRSKLAYGSRPTISFKGSYNRMVGVKMIIRGSFPYGYGSQYGINATNTFGVKKRGGIEVQGAHSTIDSCEVQIRAFGHAVYIQSPSDSTVIKNTLVEGKVRLGADMYNDGDESLPAQVDFRFPSDGYSQDRPYDLDSSYAIPKDEMYALSEDGIRLYNNGGSIYVENCTVKKTRGGIRLYLGGSSIVKNSTAIDCGSTNFNLPANGKITGSSGNFAYAPLSDFRLNRSRQTIELTILPSPNATGSHNIADIQGDSHIIDFHRTPGPLDTTSRAMVVSGNSSTITNETEYKIILESGTSGNKGSSCGPVVDNGNNSIKEKVCDFDLGETTNLLKDEQLNFQNPVRIEVYSLSGKLLYAGDAGLDAISTAKSMLHINGIFIVKSIDVYSNIKSQLIVNKEN